MLNFRRGEKIVYQHFFGIITIVALILFSIYRRVRRNIGWQQLHMRKIIFRTALFSFIGLIFLIQGALHPISLVSDVVGIGIGIMLAYYSSLKTSFEQRNGSWYYRPDIWIGSLVTAIFLVRLLSRFYRMYESGAFEGTNGANTNGFQTMNYASGNSWSSGFLLIMFGYYVLYYILLMRKQKHLQQVEDKAII
jgi:hypothetical protein